MVNYTEPHNLKNNPNNPRYIKQHKFNQLIKSIQEFPEMLELRPLVVDENMVVLGGNMRLSAIIEAGITNVPYIKVEDLTDQQKEEFIIKDNLGYGDWDWEVINAEWDTELLNEWGMDVLDFEWETEGESGGTIYDKNDNMGNLNDTFIVPPFTVLDSRQGYWRERKRVWRSLIKDFGESRQGGLTGDHTSDNIMNNVNSGVSILDPVLAESLITWFTPVRGKVFDVMAGDTVLGYVSGYKGHTFTGIEIREEQAKLNNQRTKSMNCTYICDDGRNVLNHLPQGSQDLFISCPPYFDLEVYSDLTNDASAQESYEEFYDILDTALRNGIKALKDNRFGIIIIGDVRDTNGHYYDLPGDIIRTFRDEGMVLYNKAVLVEGAGTLPVRVGRYMKNRKLGKQHQEVLIFYKGDTSKIKDHYKQLEEIDYELGDNE